MITDERFDELVKRAGTLAAEAYRSLPEGEGGVFSRILDHLISNENRDEDARFWRNAPYNSLTVTGAAAIQAEQE